MNTALRSIVVAAAVFASVAASAQGFARSETHDIDARQARQEVRIERGLARGDFTRREARTLRQGQREIARVEAAAKADGHVSRFEVRQLTAMLDQADTQIRQMRHDREGRRPT